MRLDDLPSTTNMNIYTIFLPEVYITEPNSMFSAVISNVSMSFEQFIHVYKNKSKHIFLTFENIVNSYCFINLRFVNTKYTKTPHLT